MILTVRRLLLPLLAIALLAGMTGCATSLVYDRADRLTSRWVSGHVELDTAQQDALDARLAELHAWHRREQLPLYADWLRAAAARLGDEAPLSVEELQAFGAELGVFGRALASAGVPLLARVGADLEDVQVTALLAGLRDQQEQDHAAALRRAETWHQQRRARSMERFLRRFTGRLTDGQRAAIMTWSAELAPTRAAAHDNRAGWVDDLEAALARRQDTEALLAAAEVLFARPADRWSPEYAALIERNSAATTAFLADFLAGLEDRQRERAADRLRRLAVELDQLAHEAG